MDEVTLSGYVIYKVDMEYIGKSGHAIGQIEHVDIMVIIDIGNKSLLVGGT